MTIMIGYLIGRLTGAFLISLLLIGSGALFTAPSRKNQYPGFG
jgi:F0F1-type ATP synthase assembly protein I